MNTVTLLADFTNNNRLLTVEQALEAALAEVRGGKIKAARCILIFDDPGPPQRASAYEVRRANMSNSEALIALDILHDKYVRQIRGLE